jgi:hypothetical protein
MNPPMKRKITGSAYFIVVSFSGAMFMSGNSSMGVSATAGMGSASPIHHVIMSAATASTFAAWAFTPKGLTSRKKINNTMPAKKPIRSLINWDFR